MYHYRECGLSDVWLANGYEWVSSSLGKALRIRSADQLEKAIEQVVAAKPGRLTGQEFRYLRKALQMSQRDLAQTLGNNEQTIALWEKRRGPPLWADRLLRAFYREESGSPVLLRDIFGNNRAAVIQNSAGRRVFEKRSRGGWRAVSPALAKAA